MLGRFGASASGKVRRMGSGRNAHQRNHDGDAAANGADIPEYAQVVGRQACELRDVGNEPERRRRKNEREAAERSEPKPDRGDFDRGEDAIEPGPIRSSKHQPTCSE